MRLLIAAGDIFIFSGTIGRKNAESFAAEDESDQLGEHSQPAGSEIITMSLTEENRIGRGRKGAGEAKEKKATGRKEKTKKETGTILTKWSTLSKEEQPGI